MKRISILTPVILLFIFVSGCAVTGVPAPETTRERYAAAETSYQAIVATIDQLATAGTIRKGSPAAKGVAASLRTARTALNVWGAAPDDPSRQQAALSALGAAQQLLVTLQNQRQGS
jgi:hypothetical protein